MPYNYLPWPYAAKAIIQHEFDVDHLNVWVTFRFAMDTTSDPLAEPVVHDVMPPLNLWICKVDDVLKPVTVSAWQDAWTLLLTVPDIVVLPDRVTLEYAGPDENLRIRWEKQWEPWGPILSDVSGINFVTWPQVKAHIEDGDLDWVRLPAAGWVGGGVPDPIIKFIFNGLAFCRITAANLTLGPNYRLGLGTLAPGHPLHIVAAEAPDYISFLLEAVSPHHCYFGLKAATNTRNVGLYLIEGSTNRFLIDYVSGEDLLRFHNYTYGARELELLDNGDVRLPSSYGNTVGGTNHALYIDDTGKVGQQPSSKIFKTNVRELDKSEKVHQLNPIRFDCARGGRRDQPGLIAEQVKEVMPELVDYKRVPVYGDVPDPVSGDTIRGITHYETTEEPEAVRYEDLIPHLLKEIQTLRKDLDELKAEVGEHHP